MLYCPQYIAERVVVNLNLLTLTLVDERKNKKYIKCVCVRVRVIKNFDFLTYRIGHVKTTNITASVIHRPADNGITLVYFDVRVFVRMCVRVCVHACVCVCV